MEEEENEGEEKTVAAILQIFRPSGSLHQRFRHVPLPEVPAGISRIAYLSHATNTLTTGMDAMGFSSAGDAPGKNHFLLLQQSQ